LAPSVARSPVDDTRASASTENLRVSMSRSGRPRSASRSGLTDLLIDTRRFSVEADARIPSTGERATLGAKMRWVIVWPKHRAHAVRVCRRIERAVELAAAQADAPLERSPGTLDLGQLICDSHEHDVGRLANNDVLCAHAHNVQRFRALTSPRDADRRLIPRAWRSHARERSAMTVGEQPMQAVWAI